jgi:hypothetical protein
MRNKKRPQSRTAQRQKKFSVGNHFERKHVLYEQALIATTYERILLHMEEIKVERDQSHRSPGKVSIG